MPQDHAPLARLRRTIQRQTLLQPRAEFHESRERKNATALAVLLQDASPEAVQILLEKVQFDWHETLGVPPNADAGTIRRAWARLAHAHHPDKGGTQDQMVRLNTAYERAGRP